MKRPFQTLYYSSVRGRVQDWSSHGHAASEEGAIRAAVVRIFVDQYAVARIYEAGALIYTLYRDRDGLPHGRADLLRQHQQRCWQLRRLRRRVPPCSWR